ncbi:MAG: class I SAM-dependent methyltransferase [Thioalkalispiraceae bacterium]|jgi:SAM-dependent methyltransferase
MWDERYSAEEYAYGTEPNDFLKQHADKIPAGKVLCLAEGEGRNAVYLARQGYAVTAVDASSVGLQKAQRLANEMGVSIETVVSDLADYQIKPDSYAGVVSIFCHIPKPVRAKLHQSVIAGLKPGGVLLLEAYTPEQIKFGTGGPPTDELTMSLKDLHQELAGLEILHAQEIERDVIEGLYHTGRGAVVQVIAQKN